LTDEVNNEEKVIRELEKRGVIPHFYFDDLEPFHPAQTFTRDKAYFGVYLETDVVIIRGPQKGQTRRQPVLAFVTSDHDIIEANHDVLRGFGLRYAGVDFPEPPEPRFRPSSIDKWIRGTFPRVDPVLLYRRVREAFSSRVEFTREDVADVIALYVLATYVYRLFDTMPYLVLVGSSGAGKSKVLKLVGSLAFNAVEATALTGAALYLEAQGHGATLLLDDAEDLGDEEAKAIKAMLNVGYKRTGATVRGDWDRQTSRRFSVYSPKIITTIRGVNPTTGSRCIVIPMQPGLDAAIMDRSEDPESPLWVALRDELYVWALSEWSPIRDSYQGTTRAGVGLDALRGRAWELWRPLIALARYLEAEAVEGLVDRVKAFALTSYEDSKSEQADTREGVVLTFLLARSEDTATFTPKQLSRDLESELSEEISAGSLGWLFKRLGLDKYKARATESGGRRYEIPIAALREAAIRRGVDPAPLKEGSPSRKASDMSDPSETPASQVAHPDDSDASDTSDGLAPPKELFNQPLVPCEACGELTNRRRDGRPLHVNCQLQDQKGD
jgi:hypothetical protein